VKEVLKLGTFAEVIVKTIIVAPFYASQS